MSSVRKLYGLTRDVGNYSREKNLPKGKGLFNQVELLVEMIHAHITGRYRSFSPKTIFLIVFSLLYFITPSDLVPDFLPVVGFADDMALIYAILRSINRDLKKFLDWEAQNSS